MRAWNVPFCSKKVLAVGGTFEKLIDALSILDRGFLNFLKFKTKNPGYKDFVVFPGKLFLC